MWFLAGVLMLAALALPAADLHADEGMWMPQQVPEPASRLRAMGFQGDPKAFADLTGQPMGAVVSLGGCSASFVSPDGLMVTNHHCVTGSLQFNSTPQRNLLRDGFLARTREAELSNGPGARVLVTNSAADVTDAITGDIDAKATDRQRYDIIERRIKERVAACEKDGQRCNVASFFGGLKYFEIAQLEIRDVRLVYAPAEGIGVFGGETDNWRWPRHAGDWSRIRENQQRLQRTLDATLDRALLRWAMGLAAALPADQRIEALDRVAGLKPGMSKPEAEKAINAYVDGLYAGTKMGDQQFRLALLEKSAAELEAAGDSFIALAASLNPLTESIKEATKNQAGAYARLQPRYMKALLTMAGGLVAPDANSTLRVTYGQVKGVEPRDGIFYLPQTTLAGIAEKNTGEGEFNAPQKELDAIKALRAGKKTPYVDATLKEVPVNFLSTVDSTGGNSGSPALNSKGELVGLLFDGTYETVASDYLFDPVKTRSIQVDSRYMLWAMTEVDDATNLLKEMGIK